MEKGKQTSNWSSASLDDGNNVIAPSTQRLCREQCLISIPIFFLTLGQKSVLAFLALTSQIFVCFVLLLYLKEGTNALTVFAVDYSLSHSDYGLQLLLTGEVCIIVSVHLLTVIIFSSLSFNVS